jgi:hypothetical protein
MFNIMAQGSGPSFEMPIVIDQGAPVTLVPLGRITAKQFSVTK